MTSLDVIVTFSDNIILIKDTDRNTSLIFNDSIYHLKKTKKKNYILSILSDFNTSIEL